MDLQSFQYRPEDPTKTVLGVDSGGQRSINIDDLSNFTDIISAITITPSSQNNPFEGYAFLITFNKCIQIIIDYWGSNKIMFRSHNNGLWLSWHTFTMTD